MSTAPTQQRDRAQRRARSGGHARPVLLATFDGDVDLLTEELDLGNRANLDAGDADRRARLEPGDVANITFNEYRCQKKPPADPSRKIMNIARARAMIDTMPIFNSDQASERVRGMKSP